WFRRRKSFGSITRHPHALRKRSSGGNTGLRRSNFLTASRHCSSGTDTRSGGVHALLAELYWLSFVDWNTFQPALSRFTRNNCIQTNVIDDHVSPVMPPDVLPGSSVSETFMRSPV